VAEIIFSKVKGVQKENLTVDLENFIAVKGIKALGNQLTTDKVRQINLLEPLPFEAPEEEIPEEMEVKGEVDLTDDSTTITLDDDGQITLSLD
jgi:topoisomerase-4 subunit A